MNNCKGNFTIYYYKYNRISQLFIPIKGEIIVLKQFIRTVGDLLEHNKNISNNFNNITLTQSH